MKKLVAVHISEVQKKGQKTLQCARENLIFDEREEAVTFVSLQQARCFLDNQEDQVGVSKRTISEIAKAVLWMEENKVDVVLFSITQ